MSKGWIYKSVIVLLVLFFIGGVGWGLWEITMNEGVFIPEEAAQDSLTEPPQTKLEVLQYLDGVMQAARQEKPKVEQAIEFWIPDEAGITFSVENALLDSTAAYMKNKITSSLNGKMEPKSISFGGDIQSVVPAPKLDDSVLEATCSYTETNEAGEETVTDYNQISILLPTQAAPAEVDSLLANNFHLRTDAEIRELFGDAFAAYFTVSSYTLNYENCRILASVNRLTDKISSLTYVKSTTATLTLQPVGALSALGELVCTVVFEEYNKYSFTWQGVSLDKNTLSLEKGDKDNLLAYLTADGDIHATWHSSDESVVSVDEDGYLKAHKNGEATITATMDFLGKTYQDTCVVYVRKSVEGILLNDNKMTLAVGETETLTVQFSPRRATVQTCTWHTEDAAVATVDANGVVTAVGKGETVVFALSDDGSYRSSCKVVVE